MMCHVMHASACPLHVIMCHDHNRRLLLLCVLLAHAGSVRVSGVEGWRFAFLSVGMTAWLAGAAIYWLATDPRHGSARLPGAGHSGASRGPHQYQPLASRDQHVMLHESSSAAASAAGCAAGSRPAQQGRYGKLARPGASQAALPGSSLSFDIGNHGVDQGGAGRSSSAAAGMSLELQPLPHYSLRRSTAGLDDPQLVQHSAAGQHSTAAGQHSTAAGQHSTAAGAPATADPSRVWDMGNGDQQHGSAPLHDDIAAILVAVEEAPAPSAVLATAATSAAAGTAHAERHQQHAAADAEQAELKGRQPLLTKGRSSSDGRLLVPAAAVPAAAVPGGDAGPDLAELRAVLAIPTCAVIILQVGPTTSACWLLAPAVGFSTSVRQSMLHAAAIEDYCLV
jgi:hypothetical protein